MSNDKNQLIIPQVTGYGLKGFEDNSGYFDKKLSSNLDNMKLIDLPMDLISKKHQLMSKKVVIKRSMNRKFQSLIGWRKKSI